ncbi:MAG: TRAM domain-containing protein [Verrucomicrobia bacterium]|nr:TRAM domain-containing protein [Verrucomicrobiota bacterium]
MSLWAIRIFFLGLCTLGGYAVSQVTPDLLGAGAWWTLAGFGLGGLLIAVDEMLKGFSLRAFSAATVGLVLGSLIAWMIERSQLFRYVQDESTMWLIRLMLFVSFGYIGMVMAMRSNKEDFALIIPYIRFQSHTKPHNTLLLDTSVIIDGRIADLIESGFVEGTVIVPRFVLRELQQVADSADMVKRGRGRRGLDILARLQRSPRTEVKIHEADPTGETEVDAKLLHLAKLLDARLYTNDYNLGKIAELQGVHHVSITALAAALKPVILPGETLSLRVNREGKDKGQGIGYLSDGTMVVINNGSPHVGQQVEVQVGSLLHNATGVMIFADIKAAPPANPPRTPAERSPA